MTEQTQFYCAVCEKPIERGNCPCGNVSSYPLAGVESDEEEVARMTKLWSGTGGRSHRLLAAMTLEKIKGELDEVPRRRLLKRYRLVREAKLVAKDAGLV